MLKLNILIVTIVVLGLGLFLPKEVSAQQPRLSSEFSAKNLTTNSDWGLPVSASAGDLIRYRLTIVNADGAGMARSVKVKVRLPLLGYKSTLAPKSYVTALNGVAVDALAETELVNKSNYGLEYVIGTSRLVKKGSSQTITPDTEYSNVTLTQVNVGDIVAGVENAAVIEIDAKVITVEKESKSEDITPTPVTGEVNSASSSAIANKAPETGFMDPVWINTIGWSGVGVVGLGLRSWAGKLRKKII